MLLRFENTFYMRPALYTHFITSAGIEMILTAPVVHYAACSPKCLTSMLRMMPIENVRPRLAGSCQRGQAFSDNADNLNYREYYQLRMMFTVIVHC